MKTRKLLILLLFFMFCNPIWTQKLIENKFYSTHKYIFKLDSFQAKSIFSGDSEIDSFFKDLKLIDSFNRDTVYDFVKLGFGNFLLVDVQNHIVKYETFTNHPFLFEVWGTNKRHFLTLKTHQNKLISNAKVTLSNQKCEYLEGVGAYLLPKFNQTKILKMEYQNHVDFISVNTSNTSNARIYNQKNNSTYNYSYVGYFVSNQPIYKHKDTLKWKAYLLDYRFKPINKTLKLYLSDGKSLKFIKNVNAKTLGAYFGELVLPDSLLMNYQYELKLKTIDGFEVKSVQFQLDNYELIANRFKVDFPRKNNQSKDKIKLKTYSLNVNNLPVLGTKITVDLKVVNISQYSKDRVFIPNEVYQKYYQLEFYANDNGINDIQLPDSLFKSFDAEYFVKVTMIDNENNYKEFTSSFSYSNHFNPYPIIFSQDSLFIDADSGFSKNDFVLVEKFKQSEQRTAIKLPYKNKINFNTSQWVLEQNKQVIQVFNLPEYYTKSITFDYRRTIDSIFIASYNPMNIPMFYEIYYNEIKIKEGSGMGFNYRDYTNGYGSYHVIWSTNLKGDLVNNFKVESFHLKEKLLNISINQPQEVYPGQKLELEILVTDHFNRPVKDVNLTAYAVNAQFQNIKTPDVPYLGIKRGGYPLERLNPGVSIPQVSKISYLNNIHYQKLSLHKNEYYRLFYSAKGYQFLNFKINSAEPKLSVFVMKNNSLNNIVYIKSNNQMVYHQYNVRPKSFVFHLEPGIHQLEIRTFDQLYQFKDVKIEQHQHCVLGINADVYKTEIDTNLMAKGFLIKKEFNEFLNQTVFLSIKNNFDTLEIIQESKTKVFVHVLSDYKSSSTQFNLNGNFGYAYGPVNKQQQIDLKLNNLLLHQFIPEKEMSFSISENAIKPLKITQDLKNYTFLNNYIIHDKIYNLRFDELFQIEKNEKPAIVVKPQIAENQYLITKSYNPNSNLIKGTVLFQNEAKAIKNLYLFNKNDDRYSVIASTYTPQMIIDLSGIYDLVLVKDSAYAVLNQLHLKTNGVNIIYLKDLNFRAIDSFFINEYHSRALMCIKAPLVSLLNPPVILKNYEIKSIKTQNDVSKVYGVVYLNQYKKIAAEVDIYAEINGVYQYGARTNVEGAFEIKNMQPGNYMLKLNGHKNGFVVIYDFKVKKNEDLYLKIDLNNFNIFKENESVDIYTSSEYLINNNTLNYTNLSSSIKSVDSYSLKMSGIRGTGIVGQARGITNTSGGPVGRGSRPGGTAYFVDGIRVNNADVREDNINLIGINQNNSEFDEVEKLNAQFELMSQIEQSNRVRDFFRDYAFWEPNLITNEQGKAYFKVKFPDNITNWNVFIPAMNGNKQTGLFTMNVRSFKPVMVQFNTPRVLTKDDVVALDGWSFNYTNLPKKVQLTMTTKDSVVFQNDTILEKYVKTTHLMKIDQNIDSLLSEFQLKVSNGYLDGEKKWIKVRPNNVEISSSIQTLLIKDSLYQLIVPQDIFKAKLYIHNSEIEKLMFEIERLKNYQYGCVEQTASKLNALLAEKVIKESLNLEFKEHKLVEKMINKLNKLKNENGLWSWWGNSYSDLWLSNYVIETLNKARLAGFQNSVYLKGLNYIEKRVFSLNDEDKVYFMNIMIDFNKKLPFDSIIKTLNINLLSDNASITLIRVKQKLGLPYSIDEISKYLQQGEDGIYFGKKSYNYRTDWSSSTLIAYDILSSNDTGKQYLPYIKKFIYSKSFPKHTFAIAKMLQLSYQKDSVKQFGEVILNGQTIKSTEFPYSQVLKKGDTINVKNKGNQSFISLVTSKQIDSVQQLSSDFKIETSFSDMVNQQFLKLGQAATFNINVEVYKTSEHVMIEVPIPGGFSYFNKSKYINNGVETHREYFDDKISIFCNELKPGKYQFKVMLIPKFVGTFHLPPSKIELMYYSEIYSVYPSYKIVVVE